MESTSLGGTGDACSLSDSGDSDADNHTRITINVPCVLGEVTELFLKSAGGRGTPPSTPHYMRLHIKR